MRSTEPAPVPLDAPQPAAAMPAAAAPPIDTSVPARAPTPPSPPLPPLDAPLAEFAADLLQRADAGDSAAACRLGIELLRCRQLQALTFGSENYDMSLQMAARLESEGNVDDAEAALQIGELDSRRRAQCAQLPPAMIARGAQLLHAAAVAGEPEAQVRYAEGSALFGVGRMDYLATPEFDQWRREAPAILRRALAAGRPEAVLLLAGGHGGGDGWIQGLLPDDPLQARAWRLLAARLLGAGADAQLERWRPLPRPTLDAFGQEEAARLAATWHRDVFDGATFGADTLIDPQMVTSLTLDGKPSAAGDVGRLCGAGGVRP